MAYKPVSKASIYKVIDVVRNKAQDTSKTVSDSRNNKYTEHKCFVYDLLLDCSIWVKVHVWSHSAWHCSRKYNKLGYSSPITKFWEDNEKSLAKLSGLYIYGSSDKYGYFIISKIDIIRIFKDLLDKANGQPFQVDIPIYDLLKKMNYPVNVDGSISLRKTYSGYAIDVANRCYPNTTTGIMNYLKQYFAKANGRAFQVDFPVYNAFRAIGYSINEDASITLRDEYSTYNVDADNFFYPNTSNQNTLTFDNIDKIWKHFYCEKAISTTTSLKSETEKRYTRNKYSICVSYETYHDRSETKTDISKGKYAILTIGDDLEEEHIRFLAENTDKK